jgi:putative PIN family toxin of toxin-antitoxin system
MKVILDTNIFISGIFWTGCSHDILELWKDGKFTLITSTDIVSELMEVLDDFKIKLPDDLIKEWVELIIENSEIVEPEERIDAVKDDPDDNIFIEVAAASEADYIISQDKHLLKLKKFRKTRIITPEEFYDLCR